MGFFEDLQGILTDFETSILAEVKDEVQAELESIETKPVEDYVVPYMNVQNINGSLFDMSGKALNSLKFGNRTYTDVKADILKDVQIPQTGIVDIFKDSSGVALYQFDGNLNDTRGKYDLNGDATFVQSKFGSQSLKSEPNSYRANNLFDGTENSVTISFWYKPTNYGGSSWTNIYTISSTNDTDWRMGNWWKPEQGNSFHPHYRTSGNTSNGVTQSSGQMIEDKWNHVVQTVSSAGQKLYVNGVLTDTNSDSAELTNFRDLVINNGSSDWQGTGPSIDQFRVFNKEISESEVQVLFNESDTLVNSVSNSSTFDFFKDNSAIALYQFENNLYDTGGLYNATGDAGSWVQGKFGTACNTANVPLSWSNALAAVDLTKGMTLSGWYKITNTSEVSRPWDLYSRLHGYIDIQTNGDFSIEGVTITPSVNIVGDGNFHHIVTVLYPENLENGGAWSFDMYLDGDTLGHHTANANTIGDGYESGLGCFYSKTSDPHTGTSYRSIIDQFRVINRPISASEVTKLFNEQ